jgi:NAD(P)-dependent dehydrogenase (short-subunit alcohol dehydrogenase family)
MSMDWYADKLAVVTGGGSGMGRELVRQLAARGCSVATCDLRPGTAAATVALAQAEAAPGVRVTGHTCDVADETQVLRFREELLQAHAADHLDLVFSNAGIGGGESFIASPRQVWERTFATDWYGVYYCARAFLPLLIASTEGVLVNTSSINGLWASLGPGKPQTAYGTAKFAVRGFTEALIEDLRTHAPHVRAAVVMPGHVGTDIVRNSMRGHGLPDPEQMTHAQLEDLIPADLRPEGATPEDLRKLLVDASDGFRDKAPVSAAQAAGIILDGVQAGTWRILIGDDAQFIDTFVRSNPDGAYDYQQMAKLAAEKGMTDAATDSATADPATADAPADGFAAGGAGPVTS